MLFTLLAEPDRVAVATDIRHGLPDSGVTMPARRHRHHP